MAGSITWHSFDLKTGRRGQQLATKTQGAFGRIIGESTDAQQTVQCYDEVHGPVPGWEPATLPGRVMLVALNEEDQPEWGGMVLRRRSAFDSWVDLDLTTLEAYLDRRYVRDHTYTQVPQGVIVQGILTMNSEIPDNPAAPPRDAAR